MIRLDMVASERHFLDHLAPIWRALPAEARGTFVSHPAFLDRAAKLGISPVSPVLTAGGPIVVASWGDTVRARRAGRRDVAVAQHGIGQSYGGDPAAGTTHPSYAGGRGTRDLAAVNAEVGLFLVPNEHSARRWLEAYPDARVEIVGSPRIESLPAYRPTTGEPIVGVSFHFPCQIVPEAGTAFPVYADPIASIARTRPVLGHAHPKIEGYLSRWYRKRGIGFVREFDDLVRMAAVYVVDNSSTLYEFAATGRPVVVLNKPAILGDVGYRRSVSHGLRFWEAAGVGINVDRAQDLAAAIDEALEDAPERRRAREAALDIVYAYRDGRASERAADALLAWAETIDAEAVAA